METKMPLAHEQYCWLRVEVCTPYGTVAVVPVMGQAELSKYGSEENDNAGHAWGVQVFGAKVTDGLSVRRTSFDTGTKPVRVGASASWRQGEYMLTATVVKAISPPTKATT